ncbi:hypothetical protein TELCIR_14996 [Teladorsagia circumcincta]|uniref:Uncharacterized protein n=1 Tax=Teladorsagia circumcincta TaxID=45464 RepID=A0A2G9TZK6_TELCI|nr:hypothetical protein TELCIR_14996 [Teladorsagia circumcincta]
MITLISKSSWKILGRLQLRNCNTVINAANGTRIPTNGSLMVDFEMRSSDGKQHRQRGYCYVTDNPDIFGWEWIQKIPELVQLLQRYVCGVTIVADPAAAYREEIVAKLKDNYADVFKTGLGRCTKMKATTTKARCPLCFQKEAPRAICIRRRTG